MLVRQEGNVLNITGHLHMATVANSLVCLFVTIKSIIHSYNLHALNSCGGLNGKCPPGSLALQHLVPTWWPYLGRLREPC